MPKKILKYVTSPYSLYLFFECWLLYSNIILAVTAVGWSLSVGIIMQQQYDLLVTILIFVMTFLMYNRDRLQDSSNEDDQANMQARSLWVSQHQQLLRFLTLGATLMASVILYLRPAAIPPILGGIGFALVYSLKILPGGKAPKQLPGVKIPYVAILWAVLTVGIPQAVVGIWNWRTGLATMAVCCFASALINLNDIRDIPGDRLVGTKTIAVMWGEKIARLISILLAGIGGYIAIELHSLGFLLVAIYITMLMLIYRRVADRGFRWLIEGAGIIAYIAVFFTSSIELAI
jgi:4-hydroxybenzoate polyprenyltransferase